MSADNWLGSCKGHRLSADNSEQSRVVLGFTDINKARSREWMSGQEMAFSESKGIPTRDIKLVEPVAAACRQPIQYK